jgi:hypothetical protein
VIFWRINGDPPRSMDKGVHFSGVFPGRMGAFLLGNQLEESKR